MAQKRLRLLAGLAGALATAMLGGAVLSVRPDPAQAAVRVCLSPVTSGVATARSEVLAKQAAIADWVSRSKAAGARNPSWRLAVGKVLKCFRSKAGMYQCVAFAAPCTISQTPGKRRRGPELET